MLRRRRCESGLGTGPGIGLLQKLSIHGSPRRRIPYAPRRGIRMGGRSPRGGVGGVGTNHPSRRLFVALRRSPRPFTVGLVGRTLVGLVGRTLVGLVGRTLVGLVGRTLEGGGPPRIFSDDAHDATFDLRGPAVLSPTVAPEALAVTGETSWRPKGKIGHSVTVRNDGATNRRCSRGRAAVAGDGGGVVVAESAGRAAVAGDGGGVVVTAAARPCCRSVDGGGVIVAADGAGPAAVAGDGGGVVVAAAGDGRAVVAV